MHGRKGIGGQRIPLWSVVMLRIGGPSIILSKTQSVFKPQFKPIMMNYIYVDIFDRLRIRTWDRLHDKYYHCLVDEVGKQVFRPISVALFHSIQIPIHKAIKDEMKGIPPTTKVVSLLPVRKSWNTFSSNSYFWEPVILQVEFIM